jgi:hypothetical protein
VERDGADRKLIEATRAKALFLCLDGLRFACGICMASYDRALSRFRTFETSEIVAAGAPAHDVMLAVADIWNVVDATNRIRTLVQRAPHLKRASSEVELFLRSTTDVEKMRNYMQHIDQEISELPTPSTPLLGSTSWQTAADPTAYITLLTGSKHVRYSVIGLVYDRIESRFVRPFELVVGNVILDVEGTVRRVRTLNELLTAWTATFELGDGERYVYQPEIISLIMTRVQLADSSR